MDGRLTSKSDQGESNPTSDISMTVHFTKPKLLWSADHNVGHYPLLHVNCMHTATGSQEGLGIIYVWQQLGAPEVPKDSFHSYDQTPSQPLREIEV